MFDWIDDSIAYLEQLAANIDNYITFLTYYFYAAGIALLVILIIVLVIASKIDDIKKQNIEILTLLKEGNDERYNE